jgi:hypothetical protein
MNNDIFNFPFRLLSEYSSSRLLLMTKVPGALGSMTADGENGRYLVMSGT